MLDMYTSKGKYAFQFDELEELAENQEDYGLDPDLDLNDLGGPGESALVVMVKSGKGGWYHRKVVSAGDLEVALAMAGLLPESSVV